MREVPGMPKFIPFRTIPAPHGIRSIRMGKRIFFANNNTKGGILFITVIYSNYKSQVTNYFQYFTRKIFSKKTEKQEL